MIDDAERKRLKVLADEAFKRAKLDQAILRDVKKLEGLTGEAAKRVQRSLDKKLANFPDVMLVTIDGKPSVVTWNPTLSAGEIEVQIRKVLSNKVAHLSLASIVVPERKEATGLLIKATSIAWERIVQVLGLDWSLAFQIPPERWEELIAGAFNRAGYDNVILTPRSGDHGRDVIAVKNGIGSIKIIGSVKAYAPNRLVKHDDVRALLGVLSGEQDSSKGMITTTSDFAPRIASDPFIRPFLPTRLELVNGEKLQEWLSSLLSQRRR